jgi:hypothetical protein
MTGPELKQLRADLGEAIGRRWPTWRSCVAWHRRHGWIRRGNAELILEAYEVMPERAPTHAPRFTSEPSTGMMATPFSLVR